MSEGLLINYARRSMAPEARVNAFVLSEPRLTWTALFFDDFPNAEIYLVGGTLRDVLLGRLPKDIDLVIRNVVLDGVEKWLIAHGACDFVGRRFGTFKFVPHGLADFEPLDIALPRTELIGEGHASGRSDLEIRSDFKLPIKEDLSRRDFTINAMAFDIRTGRLIDPFLGLHDLDAGLIRAVLNPEERFYEDATRMLRALRFASELWFGIEEKTWRSIQNNLDLLNTTVLDDDGKHRYSIPRDAIGREFMRGLVAHPVHTLHLWLEAGALKIFMPSVASLKDIVEQDGETALEKTSGALHLLKRSSFLHEHGFANVSPSVLVAAMLAFTQENKAKTGYHVCKNLYFHQFPESHEAHVNCQDVLWFLENLHLFEETDPASMRPSEFERMFFSARGRKLLLLMHAVLIASGHHSVARDRLHIARRLLQQLQDQANTLEVERLPRLIHGHDIAELEVSPGPIYRELLDQIRDAQLAHQIHTKEEAIGMLRMLVKDL
ncbi:MAG: hypothetical protein ABH846_00645 [Patescibacteria group bacterium]